MKYLHKSLYTARTRTNIDEVKRGVKINYAKRKGIRNPVLNEPIILKETIDKLKGIV